MTGLSQGTRTNPLGGFSNWYPQKKYSLLHTEKGKRSTLILISSNEAFPKRSNQNQSYSHLCSMLQSWRGCPETGGCRAPAATAATRCSASSAPAAVDSAVDTVQSPSRPRSPAPRRTFSSPFFSAASTPGDCTAQHCTTLHHTAPHRTAP